MTDYGMTSTVARTRSCHLLRVYCGEADVGSKCGRNFRPHDVGAYFPPVCGVCAPCPPLSLCCSRVMRAQVRLSGSRTVMCSVPQPSQESSILSPSING